MIDLDRSFASNLWKLRTCEQWTNTSGPPQEHLAMDLAQALQVLQALADGNDPVTGRELPADHLCQQPQVVRALCFAVQELRRRQPSVPAKENNTDTENAGKPWTAQEEQELLKAFEAGARIGQLAIRHGRTRQAIHGRLYRLGKVPAWRPGWSSEQKKGGTQNPAIQTRPGG
jgi:hypothetical protein